jgi:hypothetical protein
LKLKTDRTGAAHDLYLGIRRKCGGRQYFLALNHSIANWNARETCAEAGAEVTGILKTDEKKWLKYREDKAKMVSLSQSRRLPKLLHFVT